MGVATENADAMWRGHFFPDDENDEEMTPREHRAVSLTWDKADILLWNNIAQDIGIEPRAPVLSRLVDRERDVIVDAYDDRGMDITARAPGTIEHLYREFDAWLLDYDRDRMSEVFGR
jgi:hypothetical protein